MTVRATGLGGLVTFTRAQATEIVTNRMQALNMSPDMIKY